MSPIGHESCLICNDYAAHAANRLNAAVGALNKQKREEAEEEDSTEELYPGGGGGGFVSARRRRI